MIYFLFSIPIVFGIFFFIEALNSFFNLRIRERYTQIILGKFVSPTSESKHSLFISENNKISFVVFGILTPLILYQLRGGYLVRFGLVERVPAAELLWAFIFVIVGFFLAYFYISSLWHSLYEFDDKVVVIPINPTKAFSVSKENLFVSKGTKNTVRRLAIYQIYNAEQDRWYYCLLAGIENLSLEEKVKAV